MEREPVLIMIFVIFFLVTLLVNMDHGSVPAATSQIAGDLSFTKVEIGAVGSLVFVGLTAGSSVAGICFHKFNPKWIISLFTLLTGLFLILFPLSQGNRAFVYLARLMTGFCQVFVVVYFPVWVDIFSPEKWRTLWLTFLQLAVPLGVIMGYSLTAFMLSYYSWQLSFYIEGCILIPCGFIMMFIPKDMVIYTENKTEIPTSNKFSILELVKNKVYICTVMCISCLYFVVTGIQFWASDYILSNIQIDAQWVFPTYALLTITAPTLGILSGGAAAHSLGGYKGKHAILLCLVFGVGACACAIPLPFVNDFVGFIILLWFVLFFGAAIMPIITGIMISSVKTRWRTSANSFASVITNMFGYLPAPFLYGLVCHLTGGEKSRYGLMMILYWSLIGQVFITLAFIYKRNIKIAGSGHKEV